jgi:hypothetical protein
LFERFKNLHLPVVEEDRAGEVWNFATRQGHQLDAPGKNRDDGDEPLEALGGFVLVLLDRNAWRTLHV